MNTDWNTFLQQAGAVMADNRVNDFGAPAHELQALDHGNIIADVSHMGLIAVQGADAATFLQGQLTNDIREVAVIDASTTPAQQRSQLSAYCSPKGRMLACMRIFMRGDTYYLSLPREILDATLQRLRMFILRAKVTLSDASDTLVYIGYAGEHAVATLNAAVDTVPAHINEVIHTKGLTLLRLPGSPPRFGIIGEAATVQTLWNTLRTPRRDAQVPWAQDAQERPSAQPVGANAWDLLDIRAGIPIVYNATRDAFIPQMTNLDAIGGINFKKGCYTGQEIVARMHYLGTLKRRMFLAKITAEAAPQSGDALYVSDAAAASGVLPLATNLQSIGTIVAAQASPHGGYEALAVVEIKSAETHQIHLLNATGPILTFAPLPYTPE